MKLLILLYLATQTARGADYAITVDDPHTYPRPLMKASERTAAILKHLKTGGKQATLFVCGQKVDRKAGRELLKSWDQAGHEIANHTYSHLNYHRKSVTTDTYLADAAKGEKIIAGYKNFVKRFRFPFLKAGDTATKRDAMRQFLDKNKYQNGYVTIDNSDWYISDNLVKALRKNSKTNLEPYKKFYLDHILDKAKHYDDMSRQVLGRSVKHTLLIHHNLLNALFLGDLIAHMKKNGWNLIDSSVAFADPVFMKRPQVLPAGESILWSLAKESGKYNGVLRYAAEDSKYEKDQMKKLGLVVKP